MILTVNLWLDIKHTVYKCFSWFQRKRIMWGSAVSLKHDWNQSKPLKQKRNNSSSSTGGWALIHLKPQPALVGHTLEVTCVVRGKKPLSEVILYRDGVEVMRNRGNNPHFLLSNLTTEDHGLYSCRASWNVKRQTQSVISIETLGRVVGEHPPAPNRNIQHTPVCKQCCFLFFQRFCQSPFWRWISRTTKFPKGWSSFATTSTTLLLLALRYTFISTRTAANWEQQHRRTGCRSIELQACTVVRSGFPRWTWWGGATSRALDKCQVFPDPPRFQLKSHEMFPFKAQLSLMSNRNTGTGAFSCPSQRVDFRSHSFTPSPTSPALSLAISQEPCFSLPPWHSHSGVYRGGGGKHSPLHWAVPQPSRRPGNRRQLWNVRRHVRTIRWHVGRIRRHVRTIGRLWRRRQRLPPIRR